MSFPIVFEADKKQLRSRQESKRKQKAMVELTKTTKHMNVEATYLFKDYTMQAITQQSVGEHAVCSHRRVQQLPIP
jgi:hypothetical protein